MINNNEKINNILTNTKKSHQTEFGLIAIDDSKKLVKHLPNNYFDVIITSPPYYNLKDYKRKKQIGNGQSYEKYLNDLTLIFTKCFDACKNTGSFWLVVDTFSMNKKTILLPFEFTTKLEDIGWKLHEIIIWQKDRTIPWTIGSRFRKSFEYILFFTKSNKFKFYSDRLRDTLDLKKWWIRYPERYHPRGKLPTDVWYIPLQFQGAWGGAEFPRHLCPFPFELVERILTLVTDEGDNVFDPFAGTGAVLAQAEAMGRNYIGFELNKNFLKEFKEKTLPSALKRYKKMNVKTDAEEFNSLIILLRALKYGSIIIKEYRKASVNKHGKSNMPKCEIIIVNKKDLNNPKIPLPIDIRLYWNNKVSDIEKDVIKKLIKQEPLSYFGINPHISHVNTIRGVESFVKSHNIKKLYRYIVGNTHKFKEFIKIEELKDTLENKENSKVKSIPIFSNIKLYVEEE